MHSRYASAGPQLHTWQQHTLQPVKHVVCVWHSISGGEGQECQQHLHNPLHCPCVCTGLHHSVDKWKKPFNPILGETWQAAMPGGLQLYMEQISHHPPVSAYQVEGPGWRLEGWSQPAVVPVVKFYGIKTMAKGERHIIFDSDGSTVKMTMPHFAIKGECCTAWVGLNSVGYLEPHKHA